MNNLYNSHLFAAAYNSGTYNSATYGGTTQQTTGSGSTNTSGGLANTGYPVLIPIALGAALIIAAAVLLVTKLVRRHKTNTSV